MREPDAHGSEPRVFMWMRVPVMFHMEVNCKQEGNRHSRHRTHARPSADAAGPSGKAHWAALTATSSLSVTRARMSLFPALALLPRRRPAWPARRAVDEHCAPCAYGVRHARCASATGQPALQRWPARLVSQATDPLSSSVTI